MKIQLENNNSIFIAYDQHLTLPFSEEDFVFKRDDEYFVFGSDDIEYIFIKNTKINIKNFPDRDLRWIKYAQQEYKNHKDGYKKLYSKYQKLSVLK